MPKLIVSLLNPLKFVDIDEEPVARYVSRYMDTWQDAQTRNQWQKGAPEYFQPWLDLDTIKLQVTTNGGSPVLKIIDCHNEVHLTQSMTQKQQNAYEPEYFIYESSTALSSLAEGIYFMTMTVGTRRLISEPFDVREEHPNTLWVDYWHRKFRQRIVFETGFKTGLRINGLLRNKPPASKDTMYEDQVLDMVMLKSQPFRLVDLRTLPVPQWMADKLGRVFGCSDTYIDGVAYTKNEESKWNAAERVGNDALKEYEIELREAFAKSANEYDTENDGQLLIVLNVSSKGFSGVTIPDDIIQIPNID